MKGEEAKEPRIKTENQLNPNLFGIRRISVTPIVVGTPRTTDEAATSSVTLVRTNTNTVVIDTGSSEVEDRVRKGFSDLQVPLEKINVLVTTRSHPEFSGNDPLFVNALQHIRKEEWGGTNTKLRKVMMGTPYHWIDRYMKLVRLPFPSPGSLVMLLHLPEREELLEPNTKQLAGKVIGIVGFAIKSEKDPAVQRVFREFRKQDQKGIRREKKTNINSMKDLLHYCDNIIPGYGPMFSTRDY